jgi:hypothetical protein
MAMLLATSGAMYSLQNKTTFVDPIPKIASTCEPLRHNLPKGLNKVGIFTKKNKRT